MLYFIGLWTTCGVWAFYYNYKEAKEDGFFKEALKEFIEEYELDERGAKFSVRVGIFLALLISLLLGPVAAIYRFTSEEE